MPIAPASDLQKMVANYQPSAATVAVVKQTNILLLVGPTGAGKDSLKDILIATGSYHHLISHTTRSPRINHGVLEQNGREYHFIDVATAKKMIKAQEFVEAKVYSDNAYGTSCAEVQKAYDDHKIALTDIEVQGVAEYQAIDRSVMAVFLLPPNFTIWQERLQRRYGDVVDAADMQLRMETALFEIDQLLANDYYFAVINDQLGETLANVQQITRTHDYAEAQRERAHAVAEQLAADIRQHLAVLTGEC